MKSSFLTAWRAAVGLLLLALLPLGRAVGQITPVITGAADNPVARGGVVVLNGTNLNGTSRVTLTRGGFAPVVLTSTSFISNSSTSLVLTLPLAAPAVNGPYNVFITTPNGASDAFTLALTNNIAWTGSGGTTWADAANWVPRAVPNGFLNATVGAHANQPVVTGTQACNNLTVANAGRLTLAPGAELTTTENVTLDAGSALVQGPTSKLRINEDLIHHGAALTLDASSEVRFEDAVAVHDLRGTMGLTLPIVAVGTGAGSDLLSLAVPLAVARRLTVRNFSVVRAVAGGRLTLLSTPTATALVVQDANSGVAGLATAQRALATPNTGPGYRHYSSPARNNSLTDLATASFTPVFDPAFNTRATAHPVAGFPTVFCYDPSRLGSAASPYTGFDQGWYSPATGSTANPVVTTFELGRGYAVNLAGTEVLSFVGSLHTGDLTLTLTRGTTPGAGLHLVGNPYPAPIDWSLVTPADRPGIDAAFYVFESTGQYTGAYRSAVNGVGSSTFIGMAQGFFVRVTPGQTNGTLTFRNAHRLSDETLNVPVRRGAADVRPLVQLVLAGNGAADDVFIYAEENATAGTDAAFDAVKMVNPSGLNLASLTATGEALAIDGRPAFGAATVIPLSVQVPQAGHYTLTAAALAHLAGTAVTLVDHLTGTRTVLAAGTAYRFATATTTAPGRFFLNLAPAGAPLASATATLEAQVQLHPNPTTGRFTVVRPAGAAPASATLLNALGQVVRTLALPTPQTLVDLRGLAPGVYSLRVDGGGQAVVSRVVVE